MQSPLLFSQANPDQKALTHHIGHTIPALGFGVAFGFDKAGRDPRTLTKPAVLEAIKVGLR